MTLITTRASAVRSWLRSPIARAFVPRAVRADIAMLTAHIADHIADESAFVEHLTIRPPVETRVRLLTDNWYLRERHGAAPGALGTIVAHSGLSREDDGVLVDWGTGESVRCDLRELARAI